MEETKTCLDNQKSNETSLGKENNIADIEVGTWVITSSLPAKLCRVVFALHGLLGNDNNVLEMEDFALTGRIFTTKAEVKPVAQSLAPEYRHGQIVYMEDPSIYGIKNIVGRIVDASIHFTHAIEGALMYSIEYSVSSPLWLIRAERVKPLSKGYNGEILQIWDTVAMECRPALEKGMWVVATTFGDIGQINETVTEKQAHGVCFSGWKDGYVTINTPVDFVLERAPKFKYDALVSYSTTNACFNSVLRVKSVKWEVEKQEYAYDLVFLDGEARATPAPERELAEAVWGPGDWVRGPTSLDSDPLVGKLTGSNSLTTWKGVTEEIKGSEFVPYEILKNPPKFHYEDHVLLRQDEGGLVLGKVLNFDGRYYYVQNNGGKEKGAFYTEDRLQALKLGVKIQLN